MWEIKGEGGRGWSRGEGGVLRRRGQEVKGENQQQHANSCRGVRGEQVHRGTKSCSEVSTFFIMFLEREKLSYQ